MLPDKEWAKITKALDNGTLKMRILTDEEYKKIEADFKTKKAHPEQPALLITKKG